MKKYFIILLLIFTVIAVVNCEDEVTVDDLLDFDKGCCTQPRIDDSGDRSIAHDWDTYDINIFEEACLVDEGHTWNEGDCAVPEGTMGCKSSNEGHDNITWFYGESWTVEEVKNKCDSLDQTFIIK